MSEILIGIFLTAVCLAECLEAFLHKGDTSSGIYLIVLTFVAAMLTLYSIIKFKHKPTKKEDK